MRFRILAFVGALISASAFGPAGQAATTIVYDQAPNGRLLTTSAVQNVPSDPGFQWTNDTDRQVWAYFGTATDVTFNRISWYGSNADGNFAVGLFAASCFSCSASQVNGNGTINGSLLPAGPFGQSRIHKTLVSGSLYSYYIDLASSVTLNAATPTSAYALTIVNNYTSSPFVWGGSDSGSGQYLGYTVGQHMFLANPGNLAFTLSDVTKVAPVPLPATGWMLGAIVLLGLGAAALRARKPMAI